jgi:hypothetical protein
MAFEAIFKFIILKNAHVKGEFNYTIQFKMFCCIYCET